MDDPESLPTSSEHVWKSTPLQLPSPQFLGVDDTRWSKASSDPGGLHICIVPEIMITTEDGRSSDCAEANESDGFLLPLQQRPRSNTCPEEMFRTRKGRPPTPPPEDVQKSRSPAGKRFSFNFSPKDINGISFAQHRLSRVSEEAAEQRQKKKAQTRKFSLQTQSSTHFFSPELPSTHFFSPELPSTHFFSPELPHGKENAFSIKDNRLCRLTASCVEEKSLTQDSIDLSFSEKVIRKPEISQNFEKHIPHRGDTADVISCSSGKYRSTKDDRDNVESDQLIAY